MRVCKRHQMKCKGYINDLYCNGCRDLKEIRTPTEMRQEATVQQGRELKVNVNVTIALTPNKME